MGVKEEYSVFGQWDVRCKQLIDKSPQTKSWLSHGCLHQIHEQNCFNPPKSVLVSISFLIFHLDRFTFLMYVIIFFRTDPSCVFQFDMVNCVCLCQGDLCCSETQQDPRPVADPPAAGHPSGGCGQERDQLHPPVCPQLSFLWASRLVQQIHVHTDCRCVLVQGLYSHQPLYLVHFASTGWDPLLPLELL